VRRADAELVRLARGGDLRAFEALAERHRGPVLGLAWQLAGERDAAADIAQDALVTAFCELGELWDPARFGAWLASIVRARCAAHHRRAAREVAAGELSHSQSPLPDPAAEVAAREVARRALERIADASRMALLCHYVDGLSCREMADYFGH